MQSHNFPEPQIPMPVAILDPDSDAGYVYVISNPSLQDDLIKIGFTQRVWNELIKTESIINRNGKNKENCKILPQSLDDSEIESKESRQQNKKRNPRKETKKNNTNPCYDDYLIETFGGDKKEESIALNTTPPTPVSSYFMNWLNILAVFFIFVYYLIKKYNTE
jgi:hypothetical protein